MRIDVGKFGTILISRPAGREAFLAARAYTIPQQGNEPIELDFSNVSVLTPSWADEFMRGLREQYGDQVKILPSDNASVKLTLETIGESVA